MGLIYYSVSIIMSYKKFLTGLMVAALMPLTASAVPACPWLIKVTQPDGTEVEVRKIGDEFGHYMVTADNYPVVKEGEKLCYAVPSDGVLVSSGVVAHSASDRTADEVALLRTIDSKSAISDHVAKMGPKWAERRSAMAGAMNFRAPMTVSDGAVRRIPSNMKVTNFPSSGKQKAIVILVEYTDVKFHVDNPQDYFSRMLNEEGFSSNGGTGSARDYFLDSSTGQFDCQFDVYGPITLAHNMAYYGRNDYWGQDQRPEEMVLEACDQLDATVDFSEYDRNGDGVVDNVFIYYAGEGEATSYDEDTVWPHAYYIADKHVYDGVRLYDYGCTNEWVNGAVDGVGTFIHEFSHVIGLPDLYETTDYPMAFTPGNYSVLDYGPYLNEGRTPPSYSSFERLTMGWISPIEITGPCSVTLENLNDSNRACIVTTPNENEFFLFENRQLTGQDRFLPGHGMLVWHIDYDAEKWQYNTVNNTYAHQNVDLIEANNTVLSTQLTGIPFPGSSARRSFTASTSPYFKTWNGKDLGLPLTEIDEKNGVITFDVAGGGEQLSGIAGIETDGVDGTGAVYYNLQGVRVSEPLAPGIYVRRCGGKTEKMLVK